MTHAGMSGSVARLDNVLYILLRVDLIANIVDVQWPYFA
jgi:hypothetical protein